jgi:hypothetical protein
MQLHFLRKIYLPKSKRHKSSNLILWFYLIVLVTDVTFLIHVTISFLKLLLSYESIITDFDIRTENATKEININRET